MEAQEISRAIDETFAAYSAGDIDGFVAGMAEDLHYEDTAGAPPRIGREAFKLYAAGWLNASSDGKLWPTRKIISGDEAAVELRFEATHDRQPIFGVEPSGKRVEYDFAIMVKFRAGKVQSLKAFYNPLTTMQQIGLVGDLPTSPT